ncbi:alanine racemase [Candidatus Gromoviella agglomerans]|uniref:alanine racemase n=1 Tax=Candidatus Gromoviella agglomerans TaxID=2806609 RepID=UPI001E45A3D5|nr:alanine racemase [Candidatus Gromoviella agglomerans]UFX98595.1 Alanine racemase [Candidatus Gromoviella agglomerans]
MISISNFEEYDILNIWRNDSIMHNYRILKKKFQECTGNHSNDCCAVTIKNSLYGADLIRILYMLYEEGCRYYFVASLREGIEAQNIFSSYRIFDAKIMILNGLMSGQEEFIKNYNLIPCINSLNQLKMWNNFAKMSSIRGKCVIHLDSGMTRHGISYLDALKISSDKSIVSNSDIEMYISHFYALKDECQESDDYFCTTNQINAFYKMLDILPPRPFSFSATDGVLVLYGNVNSVPKFDRYKENFIKPGCGLIGAVPSADFISELKLAFEVYVRVSAIVDVEPGQNIGYSVNIALSKTRIAIINIGYGDGYMKNFIGTDVFICGYNARVIAINLNCSIIDVSNIEDGLKDDDGYYRNDLYVEICGPNVDIRYTAIRDGHYQVFDALGHGSINVKRVFL